MSAKLACITASLVTRKAEQSEINSPKSFFYDLSIAIWQEIRLTCQTAVLNYFYLLPEASGIVNAIMLLNSLPDTEQARP